ncbi:MAG TPA: Glu-tRNA(Gln) amidotransferase subunit GatD [Geobacterales bacterium]|nr:Glu-tRNA(Gln) amidotransferase subunit GatD [Geobacterales bacterium]
MLQGYEGELKRILESKNIDVGDLIEVSSSEFRYTGILMSRYEIFDRNYLTIKLSNGYNIGIKYDPSIQIKLLAKQEKKEEITGMPEQKGDIVLIGTGGTILSRIDYRTGAVKPSYNIEDLLELIPEAKKKGIKMVELFKLFSEDMQAKNYELLASKIYEEILSGAKGFIVTHGTDTLGLTSAALSFAIQNLPYPIALVGAQRSLDRPSSDAALNLRYAYRFVTESKFAGVFVIMHSNTSDESCDVILGTRARKEHTSRRDAFKSINRELVAKVNYNGIEYLNTSNLHEIGSREPKLYNNFEEKVFLIKTFPGIGSEIIEFIVDRGYKGLLIEGTGLGHVPKTMIEGIRYAIEKGVFVALASQCINGRVNMNVYERGRELLKLGVVGCEDMFAETALIKMMWSLGNAKDVEDAKKLFLTNIAGEISERSVVL